MKASHPPQSTDGMQSVGRAKEAPITITTLVEFVRAQSPNSAMPFPSISLFFYTMQPWPILLPWEEEEEEEEEGEDV